MGSAYFDVGSKAKDNAAEVLINHLLQDFDVRKPKSASSSILCGLNDPLTRKGHRLCITAKRDIPAGQELTITYVGEVEGDLMESSSQSGTNMSLRTPRGKGKDGKLQDPHTGSVHVDTTTDLPTACYW